MATTLVRPEGAGAYPLTLPPRAAIEAAVETLMVVLDALDGDPDAEEVDAEDSFELSWYAREGSGAGCPISDPGGGSVDDEGEEAYD